MAAHSVTVDDVVLPARLSGHAALDFCNTWAGWDGRETGEYLEDYDHLAVFAGFVGVLPEKHVASLRGQGHRRTRAAATALNRARRFRGSLYDVLREGGATSSWDLVAREVEAAGAARRLRHATDGARWELDSRAGLAAPILAIAWSAGELLTSSELAFVRACPGVGCGWLFLDRRGRRRWCTMSTCGNREKARRFAERRRHK